jgi:dipeptidyl aminopeptidase/acylaminoacyl peptidase
MPVELIPREVLYGNPERSAARISPDGTRVAFLAPVEGVLNVWVAEGTDITNAMPVTDDRDRGIRSYLWARDNRHLLYVQDRGGDENWRLYSVDLPTGHVADLTPFEGIQVQPIHLSSTRPSEVLVGINRTTPQYHDVYLINLDTETCELVATNTQFAGPSESAWFADDNYELRAAERPTADGTGYEVCVPIGDDWEPVLTIGFEDAMTTQVLGVTGDGKSLLLVSSMDANAGRLVRLDLTSREIQVLAEDPAYDVRNVLLHPVTREPQVVTFVRERADNVAVDTSVMADLAAASALGTGDVGVEGGDDDDRRWVVNVVTDDGPACTFALDRSTRESTLLFEDRPSLRGYTLAKMEPFSYSARDGLTIHGYLTFPVGEPRRDLPAVLSVHGGPWSRDVWGLNPQAQWLANRGYLCVQVNFRGSSGYGKDFLNAGDREWGGRMHDDLLDAVEWVVAQGYADRSRIGIMGGSYGGYAALAGAAFTPDVFACAVDIVGPANLQTLLESIPPYWVGIAQQFKRRIGDVSTDQDFLWSRSPLSKAADIKIPLLIGQGANDPRVPQAEPEQIIAELEANNIPYQYLLFPDEGHGFAKPENRMRFTAAAEAFLAEHLGGRFEPEVS